MLRWDFIFGNVVWLCDMATLDVDEMWWYYYSAAMFWKIIYACLDL